MLEREEVITENAFDPCIVFLDRADLLIWIQVFYLRSPQPGFDQRFHHFKSHLPGEISC